MGKLRLKPYRPRLIHGLLEDDPDRRLQFCEMERDQIAMEQDFGKLTTEPVLSNLFLIR
jgi:hypothetical protein